MPTQVRDYQTQSRRGDGGGWGLAFGDKHNDLHDLGEGGVCPEEGGGSCCLCQLVFDKERNELVDQAEARVHPHEMAAVHGMRESEEERESVCVCEGMGTTARETAGETTSITLWISEWHHVF